MYVVIMAGGGGTRLWPLSRAERPKPFLPLVGDRTLFQRTVDRARSLVDDPGDVYCVTDRKYGHFVQEQAPDIRLLVGVGWSGRYHLYAIASDEPRSIGLTSTSLTEAFTDWGPSTS